MKTYYTLLFSMIFLVSCSKEDASHLEDLDPDIPFYDTLEPSQIVIYELDRGALFPEVIQSPDYITLFFPADSAYVYHKSESSFKRYAGIPFSQFTSQPFQDDIFLLKHPQWSAPDAPYELFIWDNATGSAKKVNIPNRVLEKIWTFEDGVGIYDRIADKLVIIGPDQTQQSISFPPIIGEHKILEFYFDPESAQFFRISVLFDESLSTYYLTKENSDGMVKDTLLQIFDSTDPSSLSRFFVRESDVSYPYYYIETDLNEENRSPKRYIHDLRDNQIFFEEASGNIPYRLSHIHSASADNAIYLWGDSGLDQIDTESKSRIRSAEGQFENFSPAQLPFFPEFDLGDLYIRDYFTGERLVFLKHDNVIGHILYNHKKKEIMVADAFNDDSGTYKINIYKVPF
ncbi:MAG: hypothetical protein GVX96_04115 [Bacteroidetes bacterium]|nr:hypothetical protein [Bacteroidota bacterium]